jgi:orotate phosphoribosyltransferase-like protein
MLSEASELAQRYLMNGSIANDIESSVYGLIWLVEDEESRHDVHVLVKQEHAQLAVR